MGPLGSTTPFFLCLISFLGLTLSRNFMCSLSSLTYTVHRVNSLIIPSFLHEYGETFLGVEIGGRRLSNCTDLL